MESWACEFLLPICTDISVRVPVPQLVIRLLPCPCHWLAVFLLGAKWKQLGNPGNICKQITYPLANKTETNNLTSLKLCTVGHITFIKYKAFCDSPKKQLSQKFHIHVLDNWIQSNLYKTATCREMDCSRLKGGWLLKKGKNNRKVIIGTLIAGLLIEVEV